MSRSGYWQSILLVVVALAPGLLDGPALGLARPTVAQSLGASAADASWVTLLSSASLPLGLVVGADLTRRFRVRLLALGGLSFLGASSICAALAPDLPVLVAARIVDGFCQGLLRPCLIPPIMTGYRSRQPTTVAVFVVAFFGASSIGPTVGGFVEQTGTWRLLLGINLVLAFTGIFLTQRCIPEEPAPEPHAYFDIPAVLLSVSGIMFLFTGIGELAWHNWGSREVDIPVVLGVACVVMLIAAELLQRDPLLPVRHLVRPRPLGASIASILVATCFGALFGMLPQFLQQVRGLGPQSTGSLLWPACVAGVVGAGPVAVVMARPRWIIVLVVAGLLLLAGGGGQLSTLTRFTDDGRVMLMAAVLGLGASISLVPALIMAVFSIPRELAKRAVALFFVIRYAIQYGIGQPLTHFIATQSTVHAAHLEWQQGFNGLFDTNMVQAQPASAGARVLMQQSLVLAINDTAQVVLVIVVLGTALSVLLLLVARFKAAHM